MQNDLHIGLWAIMRLDIDLSLFILNILKWIILSKFGKKKKEDVQTMPLSLSKSTDYLFKLELREIRMLKENC